MKLIYATLALSAALLLSGCKAGNKLVGVWEGASNQMGQQAVTNLTINADSTFVQTTTMQLPKEAGGKTAEVSIKGKWTSTEDSKLGLASNELSVTGFPDQIKPMVEAAFNDQKGKEQVATIKWNGNDEFTFALANGPSITLKRKK